MKIKMKETITYLKSRIRELDDLVKQDNELFGEVLKYA
jgi:hypothetical protein